jgi:hypothetical protein
MIDLEKYKNKTGRWLSKLSTQMQTELIDATNWLPYDAKNSERLYCLSNNITSLVKCKSDACNNHVKYIPNEARYFDSCSRSCAARIQMLENNHMNRQELREKVASRLKEVRNSERKQDIDAKIKQTSVERYGGIGFASPELADKTKTSLLEKYGVDNAAHSKAIRQKAKRTNISKYGVEHILSAGPIRDSINRKNIKKYGFSIPNQYTNIVFQNKELSISQYTQLHGRNTTHAFHIYRSLGESELRRYVEDYDNWKADNCSSLERSFSNLTNLPFHNISPFPCGKYRPDFKLDDITYIDTDGLYWHSESNHDKSYHFDKRLFYESHGLRLYQFREDEIRSKPDIIRSMLSLDPVQKYRASNLTTKKVKYLEAKEFLNTNHIQGAVPAITYGLYEENILLCLISIKRNFKSEWEISRFCSKLNTRIHGGFSKLLKHVLKEHDIKQIYSWCDLRYSQGQVYESNGFIQVKTTLGWSWTDYVRTYPRLRFREDCGLDKIYDAGQRLYVLEN